MLLRVGRHFTIVLVRATVLAGAVLVKLVGASLAVLGVDSVFTSGLAAHDHTM